MADRMVTVSVGISPFATGISPYIGPMTAIGEDATLWCFEPSVGCKHWKGCNSEIQRRWGQLEKGNAWYIRCKEIYSCLFWCGVGHY